MEIRSPEHSMKQERWLLRGVLQTVCSFGVFSPEYKE